MQVQSTHDLVSYRAGPLVVDRESQEQLADSVHVDSGKDILEPRAGERGNVGNSRRFGDTNECATQHLGDLVTRRCGVPAEAMYEDQHTRIAYGFIDLLIGMSVSIATGTTAGVTCVQED